MKNYIVDGYSVKSVSEKFHKEGRFFMGNLYLGSVKIAEFEEHGRGAPMSIFVKNDDMYDDFKSASRVIEGSDYSEVDAIVIEEMVNSFMARKRVMSGRKKKTLFSTDINGISNEYSIDYPYSEDTVQIILKEFSEDTVTIGNEEFDIYPDNVERVYRDGM